VILDVRYAKAADGTHVAYAVLGDGPIDIVYSFGYLSNIDDFAEWDIQTALWDRLASFARLIVFDRRGSGLSDPTSMREENTLEAGMDDIRAVMDAAGSERALVVGLQDGGMLCTLFAASHPDRTLGLVLYGSSPRGLPAPDFPWAWTAEEWDDYLTSIEQTWGTPKMVEDQLKQVFPNVTYSPDELKRIARHFRSMASPGAALAVERMLRDLDVRPVLPAIRVPTLVLHAARDVIEPVGAGRYIAESIPGARFVELPGGDHVPHGEMRDRFVEEVRRFAMSITDEEAELGRVLGTVLFTDIVGSTQRAAELGDRAWGELVERHHSAVRAMLARYRGKEVDTAGDGFFATFDGPVRAVRCAQQIRDAVEPLGLQIRAGIHTGELHTIDEKVAGLGVVIGARVGALAGASEVLVSQTVKDLVAGSGLSFEDGGEHQLKGVPDRWRVYRVVG
jgi:pimeloyl-ACP methyl ester carboxylesterase/plasmid stabilization system protein ParE